LELDLPETLLVLEIELLLIGAGNYESQQQSGGELAKLESGSKSWTTARSFRSGDGCCCSHRSIYRTRDGELAQAAFAQGCP
jgi:hypothetical protein